jgi:F0F1-type ATP synthase membrane subunit c/vacuolar-type H+-ATPase subunit K
MRKLVLTVAGGFALALAVSTTALAEGGCGGSSADNAAESASAPYTPAPTAAQTQTGTERQG